MIPILFIVTKGNILVLGYLLRNASHTITKLFLTLYVKYNAEDLINLALKKRFLSGVFEKAFHVFLVHK